MNKDIVIFKKNYQSIQSMDSNLVYELKIWRPRIFSFVPPTKDYKYLLYWVFHFGRIFKNRSYSAYFLYNGNELVSSFLIIPSNFKWPFMGPNDVQFTYVMTNERYKGRGIAGKLIKKAIMDLGSSVDACWYVTDTQNAASIRVAEKMGFSFYGNADRTRFLKRLKLRSNNVVGKY